MKNTENKNLGFRVGDQVMIVTSRPGGRTYYSLDTIKTITPKTQKIKLVSSNETFYINGKRVERVAFGNWVWLVPFDKNTHETYQIRNKVRVGLEVINLDGFSKEDLSAILDIITKYNK